MTAEPSQVRLLNAEPETRKEVWFSIVRLRRNCTDPPKIIIIIKHNKCVLNFLQQTIKNGNGESRVGTQVTCVLVIRQLSADSADKLYKLGGSC